MLLFIQRTEVVIRRLALKIYVQYSICQYISLFDGAQYDRLETRTNVRITLHDDVQVS